MLNQKVNCLCDVVFSSNGKINISIKWVKKILFKLWDFLVSMYFSDYDYFRWCLFFCDKRYFFGFDERFFMFLFLLEC